MKISVALTFITSISRLNFIEAEVKIWNSLKELSIENIQDAKETIFQEPSQKCQNDDSFMLNGNARMTCRYIRKEEERRQHYCLRPEVRESCPQTCGICCQDDEDYSFTNHHNNQVATCEFISKKPEIRSIKWCDRHKEGRMVQDACPQACDFCQELVPLLPVPSSSPTVSTRPSSSSSPSIIPTAVPSLIPSQIPTSSSIPSTKPISCKNDPNFRFKDKDNGHSCQKIRLKESRRQKFCKKEDVYEHCQLTCGACCEDDESYTFTTKLGIIQDCKWIEKRTLRQSEYCDTFENGRMVRDACPKTCGFCKEHIEPKLQ